MMPTTSRSSRHRQRACPWKTSEEVYLTIGTRYVYRKARATRHSRKDRNDLTSRRINQSLAKKGYRTPVGHAIGLALEGRNQKAGENNWNKLDVDWTPASTRLLMQLVGDIPGGHADYRRGKASTQIIVGPIAYRLLF